MNSLNKIQILILLANDQSFTSEIRRELTSYSEKFHQASAGYKALVEDLITIFEKLTQVESETESQRRNTEFAINSGRESIGEIRTLLEKIQAIDRLNLDILNRVKSEVEVVIPKIYEQEPVDFANMDVEKLNRVLTKVLEDWANYAKNTSSKLKDKLEDFRVEQEKCTANCIQVKNLNLNIFLDIIFLMI